MNDIFISYDRTDRARAQRYADALESLGWSVFWDPEIPLGKSFDQVIEEELSGARCVLVLWSKESVQSRWVKSEASAALDRGRLLPVFIEKVPSPLEFRLIQGAELLAWNGDTADPEFQRLLDAIREMLGRSEAGPRAVPLQPAIQPKPKALSSGWVRGVSALIIIALLILGIRNFQSGRKETESSSAGVAASSTSGSSDRPAVSKEAFQIKVGDKIDDGVPAAGAGNIGKAYEHDQYSFVAKPGQRVYFRMLGHSNWLPSMVWHLTDENAMEVFRTCLGCSEPGVQSLTKGGIYTLTVGAENDPATGTYQLQLLDVPPPRRFSIRIGDVIQENKPGAGAGLIESPGSEDVYTFTAEPRQRVYFRMLEESTGMSSISWQLVDDNGMEVFKTCLGCTEPGMQVLIKGGSYVLTVGNRINPATGLYRLQLFKVQAPDQFTVKPGDIVKPGFPGAGAGVIETPGAEDVYLFTAPPGQKVSFRLLEFSKGTDSLSWRLEDDNGMEVFKSCFACTPPEAQTLIRGGTYRLTVGSGSDPATGNYSFEIVSK